MVARCRCTAASVLCGVHTHVTDATQHLTVFTCRNGRQYGTPWSCTLIHDAKHGDGYYDERATVFQFPWFLEVLSQIPDNLLKSTYRAPVALQRPKSQSQGWLGNMERIIERCCAFRGEPDTHKGLTGCRI